MSDPPSYDQDLLARLNALKKTSISVDAAKPQAVLDSSKQATPESDLSARLRSLRNASSSSSQSPAPKPSQIPEISALPSIPFEESDPLRSRIDIDDKTLDELLADLGPDDQWTVNLDDPVDIQKLLNEAKSTLPRIETKPESSVDERSPRPAVRLGNLDKAYLTKDLDMSVFALDDEGEPRVSASNSNLEDESREAQDIVAKLLDEVNFERENEPIKPEDDEDTPGKGGDQEDGGLSLLSAPSKFPDPSTTDLEPGKKSLDFENDIAARMVALKGLGSKNELGLPSAPTFKPVDKPVKGVMKKPAVDEVDTWCVIFSDNATVKCLGCDGDLYCANCWKEGHMGLDAGWDEKRHKWTKYKKPN